jgi:hypothetical protein
MARSLCASKRWPPPVNARCLLALSQYTPAHQCTATLRTRHAVAARLELLQHLHLSPNSLRASALPPGVCKRGARLGTSVQQRAHMRMRMMHTHDRTRDKAQDRAEL